MLQQLHHDNIVNLIERVPSADYVKKNGKTYKVFLIVMEIVESGELFEYIITMRHFPEKLARAYFRQLIDGIEYCHNQGICHRDLKPENLLLDKDFNLKIADFGYAALVKGHSSDSDLHTVLGTKTYMAPEINLEQPYKGPAVDLFAAGVILFIMVAGSFPFGKAVPQDEHYKKICTGKYSDFWKTHDASKPKGFFSDDFKGLINNMLAFDPVNRLSLAEIKAHPWYKGETTGLQEFQKKFIDIQKKLVKDQEAEKQKKMLEKKGTILNKSMGGVKPHRGIDGGDEKAEDTQTATRVMEDYEDSHCARPLTEIDTKMSGDEILATLQAFSGDLFTDYKVSNDQYKIKAKIIKEISTVEFTIKIFKKKDGLNCAEFTKKAGNSIAFLESIEAVRTLLL
mmetsp:Transcript_20600/g.18011  ORF Transcript_20600/g.18011 Transcript_20600/m.18011 type:complete len:397 (+) Transcript_20600:306-1496(+)